jgi:predicted RNase H-like HicB family nuclease
MSRYIGLIHKDAGTDYGVSFPDFPGLITAAASLDEARAMAEEVLAFHIEGLVEDGVPIPEPTDLNRIMCDPNNRDGIPIAVATRFNTSA